MDAFLMLMLNKWASNIPPKLQNIWRQFPEYTLSLHSQSIKLHIKIDPLGRERDYFRTERHHSTPKLGKQVMLQNLETSGYTSYYEHNLYQNYVASYFLLIKVSYIRISIQYKNKFKVNFVQLEGAELTSYHLESFVSLSPAQAVSMWVLPHPI